MADALLAQYDGDESLREVIAAMYLTDRRLFISSVIGLAVSEGYGRRESVEFAKAVCARVRESLGEEVAPGAR